MNDLTGRLLIAAALLALFVLVLLLMRAGWRAKARAQADIPAAPEADAVRGEVIADVDDAHYVATTLDGRPLERLVAEPFGFRGRCRIEVCADGLRVELRGTRPFAIPLAAIDAVDRCTATIDRAVEADGLTNVAWRLGAGGELEVPVHTTFRIVDRADRDRIADALDTIRPDQPASTREPR